jgi:hypothetical protein
LLQGRGQKAHHPGRRGPFLMQNQGSILGQDKLNPLLDAVQRQQQPRAGPSLSP